MASDSRGRSHRVGTEETHRLVSAGNIYVRRVPISIELRDAQPSIGHRHAVNNRVAFACG